VVVLGLFATSEMVRIVSRRECEFDKLGLIRSGKQDKLGSVCLPLASDMRHAKHVLTGLSGW
jgi:hypothetical protein